MTTTPAASTPGVTPQASPATATDAVSDPKGPSLQDILQFDPFAPPKSDSSGAGADDAAAGATGSGKPAVTPAAGDAAPAAVETPEQKAAKAAAAAAAQPQPTELERAIATNTDAIRQMLERDQTQSTVGADGKPKPAAEEAPKFNLGVPDAILNALSSEDPGERKIATHAIVNGVANAVWRETDKLVRSVVQEIVTSIPRFIQSQGELTRQQEHVASDFYGTYGVFNKTEFVPLMQNIGMQIAQEMAKAGRTPQWNDTMRDEIANRMFALFPMLKTVHDENVKAGGKGRQPAAKPLPFVANGGGARPQAEPVDEMTQILNLQ